MMVITIHSIWLIFVVTSIYSVDFHPTEPYVATAGGGELFKVF